MRLVSYSFVGVEPEVMGAGPIPATEKALKQAGLTIDDIGAFEVNEAFAVQVLAFLEHFGIADDDARVNPYGGAIAMGHPLASSGVRLMTQLARAFEERPEVRYGLTTMCIGIGMGGTVIWENPHWTTGEARLMSDLDEPARPAPQEISSDAERVTAGPARARSPCPDGAGVMGLITLDNGEDHTKPNTFGPRVAARRSTPRSTRRSPTTSHRDRRHRQAVHPRRRRRPDRRSPAAARDAVRVVAELGHAVFRKLGEGGKPSFGFVNGLALGGGLEVALHCTYRTVHGLARRPSACPRSCSAWSPAGAAPTWCRTWSAPTRP